MSPLLQKYGSCTVTLTRTDDGLLFSGHDLAAFGEPGHDYEYYASVPEAAFPAMRTALGVPTDADVLAALLANVDQIMPAGEVTWLKRHGIEHSVSVWDHLE